MMTGMQMLGCAYLLSAFASGAVATSRFSDGHPGQATIFAALCWVLVFRGLSALTGL